MNNHEIYGISQNPNTKNYILVFPIDYFDDHCKECCEMYTRIYAKWCKPCQVNYLKNNFANWTSKNEKIDDFIQKKQLNISHFNELIFEWIPYNQFDDIKELSKGD